MNMSDNARRIFDLRYPRKDEAGAPTEEPREVIHRVASNVAAPNALYPLPSGDLASWPVDAQAPEDHPFPRRTVVRQYNHLLQQGKIGVSFDSLWEDSERVDRTIDRMASYAQMLEDRDFLPNSPTWTGAGTPLGQLAACFVLPIDDDLGKSRGSIFESLKVAALIQQTGGGNGFSFGELRPRNAVVSRSMGKASGPVAFMAAYSSAFAVMAQGGTRRGANMAVMPIWHPDVREFIESKTVEGELDQFNISVAITDDFMDAVEKDLDFDLVFGGKVYDTVRAVDLYDELIRGAHMLGDPGALFIDRANRDNPVPQRYRLTSTNPCGEQWLGPYENCCLGSINLKNFVEPDGLGARVDWDRLAATVRLATEFLDDVIDANQYVPDVPELEAAALGGRRIGLGGMGLADAMVRLGISYGSIEGEAFAAQLQEFIRYHSMLTSIDRAAERGPFPWIEGSIYDSDDLHTYGPGAEMELPEVTYTLWAPPILNGLGEYDFGRPGLDWSVVTRGIVEHGIRNSCQTTWAPTGTISNVADLEGSGGEPFFALIYSRTVMQEGENIVLDYLSPSFRDALESHPDDIDLDVVMAGVKANGGSCQGVQGVPEDIQRVFVVSGDLDYEEHIRMQAALQIATDNSISKTINMRNEATLEDVNRAYRLAYELGCKGITIYRQGSRDLEVLSTGQKKQSESVVEPKHWPLIKPMPLPDTIDDDGIPSRTYKVATPQGSMHATVTEIEDDLGRPFDVRLHFGKAGNDKAADVEAIGRLTSLALRAGIRVEDVISELEGIGGATIAGFGERQVRSVPDALGKLLRRRYDDVEPSAKQARNGEHEGTQTCPACHRSTLIYADGCLRCEARLGGCGDYSGCS